MISNARTCLITAFAAALLLGTSGRISAQTAAAPPVFPSALSAKYAGQTAGRARMHTCLDQYHANKSSNANGGMNWIQKGGGYYSVCLKKLKS